MPNYTAIAIAETQAQALRDAAAETFEHTTIAQDGTRTKSQRPVLSKDVRAWLEARADVIVAKARDMPDD